MNLANILGKYRWLITDEQAMDKVPLTSVLVAANVFLIVDSRAMTSFAWSKIFLHLVLTLVVSMFE